jgi:hypothetical protein
MCAYFKNDMQYSLWNYFSLGELLNILVVVSKHFWSINPGVHLMNLHFWQVSILDWW